jgi:hypothetical protein
MLYPLLLALIAVSAWVMVMRALMITRDWIWAQSCAILIAGMLILLALLVVVYLEHG